MKINGFTALLIAGSILFSAAATFAAMPNAGDAAPAFEGQDQDGKTVKLADLAGKKIVLLYFYPKDFTGGCTKEACGFRDRMGDLATDVSWNFRVKTKIKKFKPRAPDAPDGSWRMQQEDIDRVQEFRKCIECFLCQDVCHVLRDHHKHDEFIGPRFLVYTAALEMHPLDTEDRLPELKQAQGIGFCNITKCCTKVCPENITITDNAIIPLKERVVDEFYDPLGWLWKKLRPKG